MSQSTFQTGDRVTTNRHPQFPGGPRLTGTVSETGGLIVVRLDPGQDYHVEDVVRTRDELEPLEEDGDTVDSLLTEAAEYVLKGKLAKARVLREIARARFDAEENE